MHADLLINMDVLLHFHLKTQSTQFRKYKRLLPQTHKASTSMIDSRKVESQEWNKTLWYVEIMYEKSCERFKYRLYILNAKSTNI